MVEYVGTKQRAWGRNIKRRCRLVCMGKRKMWGGQVSLGIFLNPDRIWRHLKYTSRCSRRVKGGCHCLLLIFFSLFNIFLEIWWFHCSAEGFVSLAFGLQLHGPFDQGIYWGFLAREKLEDLMFEFQHHFKKYCWSQPSDSGQNFIGVVNNCKQLVPTS